MNEYMACRAYMFACMISRNYGPILIKFNTGVFHEKSSNHTKFNFSLICRTWATSEATKIPIFYDIRTCISLKVNRRFRGTCCLSIDDLLTTCLMLVYSKVFFSSLKVWATIYYEISLGYEWTTRQSIREYKVLWYNYHNSGLYP
jgi:hypothetical protein